MMLTLMNITLSRSKDYYMELIVDELVWSYRISKVFPYKWELENESPILLVEAEEEEEDFRCDRKRLPYLWWSWKGDWNEQNKSEENHQAVQ